MSISPRNPFGILAHEVPRDAARAPSVGRDVLLMTKEGDRYIRRDQVLKRQEWIDRWKVAVSCYGGDPSRGKVRVLSPPSAVTESYLVAGTFPAERPARNLESFLCTRFCRHLLSLLALTQHQTRRCYAFIPDMPLDRSWTDGELAEFFGLSEADVAHINSKVDHAV